METAMTFKEAIELANKVGIKEEVVNRYVDDPNVTLILMDGSRLVFESEYEDWLSSETPGDGIKPPKVRHIT